MNNSYRLRCVKCRKEHRERQSCTRCLKCGDGLDVVYDYDMIEARLNRHALKRAPLRSLKYLDFYPLQDLRRIVTLHEGGTAMYRCRNLGKQFGMKNLYIRQLFKTKDV